MSKVDTWMPLYVAEYNADTSRFTTEQHGAYLLIIMDYWRNGPPPDDDRVLAQITKLTSAKWRAIRPILAPKFQVSGRVWKHKRIEKELVKAKATQQALSQRGKDGANARWHKDDSGNGTGNATAINQAMPETMLADAPLPSSLPTSLPSSLPQPGSLPSPQPEPKTTARKRAAFRPAGVSEKVWNDFLEARKAKRAPLTDTALEGIEREAGKAGMTLQAALEMACASGWQSFKAAWINGAKPDVKEEARRRIFGEEKDITHEAERF